MTKAQWRNFSEQWQRAGAALTRVHRDEIRARPYDPDAVDDLLQIGDTLEHSRETSGLVELQRWLLKLAQRRRPMPHTVHESRSEYGS
jgi:hypothetical protein